MKRQTVHRNLFCGYWLYFNMFRNIVGDLRFLDYLGMSFLILGLLWLMSREKMILRISLKVLLMFSPIIISAIIDPNIIILLFLFKMYIVILYFVLYFRSLQLTSIEMACFTFPVAISVYYLFNPAGSSGIYYFENRLSGIGDPNFTSLSFIISMCGAFGIYILVQKRLIKVLMVVIIFICCCGVLLTASRAGLIGIIIALCSFMLITRVKWYAFPMLLVGALLIAISWDSIIDITNRLYIFERFQTYLSGNTSLIDRFSEERYYTRYAWETVFSGDWFIGGGPNLVNEWAERYHHVPHDSFLDIGLAFGRASFYFYSGLSILLIVTNIIGLVASRFHIGYIEKDTLITSAIFLSLIPMYMSLSVGLTMSFALWVVLGTYALIRPSSIYSNILSKLLILRRIRLR